MSDSSEGPAAPHTTASPAAALYPLFERGGRGRAASASRGRGRAQASEVRYSALNSLALELAGTSANGMLEEGTSAAIDDRENLPPESDDEEASDRDANELVESEDEPEGGAWRAANLSAPRPPVKRRRQSAEDAFAGAALGGAGRRGPVSESGSHSSRSITSTARQREAQARIFPCEGLRCLACSLVHRLGPVDKFVNDRCVDIEETALFKFAALVWKEKVIEPIEAEGGTCPQISWNDLRAHYLFHVAHPRLQRANTIRQLALMRAKASERLVRHDDGEGGGELDKVSADLILKILTQESRERELLFAPPKVGARRAPGITPGGED